jgi:hypothetical protein|tara:strand:+ start:271 stop:483 length:213 start_codon:yes stop_codon:yes gene_type:complete
MRIMNIKNIISKHNDNWQSENFHKWKTTEIMYCKIGWVIDAIDGSEDLESHVEILLNIQEFIEDLQKFEK